MENDKNVIKEWVRYAEMDLTTAEHLFSTMSKPPLEIICFHCQQSAEKFLKGVIATCQPEPPKIHDLQRLLAICEKVTGGDFSGIKNECADLTGYAVQPRYPAELDIDEYLTSKALKDAEAVRGFIMANYLVDYKNIAI